MHRIVFIFMGCKGLQVLAQQICFDWSNKAGTVPNVVSTLTHQSKLTRGWIINK